MYSVCKFKMCNTYSIDQSLRPVDSKKYSLVMKQAWHFSVEQREDTNGLRIVIPSKLISREISWLHLSQCKVPPDCTVARISSWEWHIFFLYHTNGSFVSWWVLFPHLRVIKSKQRYSGSWLLIRSLKSHENLQKSID